MPKNETASIELDNDKKEVTKMDEQTTQENTTPPQADRLAKISLIVSAVGFVALVALHFLDRPSVDEAIAAKLATVKQEIAAEIQQSQGTQLQAALDKNAELEVRIMDLETKTSQFQVELDKNADLRAKVAALQASKSKPAAKPAVKNTVKTGKAKTTSKSKKPAKKGRK